MHAWLPCVRGADSGRFPRKIAENARENRGKQAATPGKSPKNGLPFAKASEEGRALAVCFGRRKHVHGCGFGANRQAAGGLCRRREAVLSRLRAGCTQIRQREAAR
jgi:hypothetical protein